MRYYSVESDVGCRHGRMKSDEEQQRVRQQGGEDGGTENRRTGTGRGRERRAGKVVRPMQMRDKMRDSLNVLPRWMGNKK